MVQIFFGKNSNLKLLRMLQTLQNNYFLLKNNFLISQVRDILGPSKLSKYVLCQNKLIGYVMFKFCLLQPKLGSGISNSDLINDVTICHDFHE